MKKLFSVLIIFALLFNMFFPSTIVLADSINSSEAIEGTYQYSSDEGSNIQSQNSFIYRDDCFIRSSFLGCKHLEILSMQVASASVSYYGPNIDKYEIDSTVSSHNLVKMLQDMKFNNVSINKYYTTEKHENSMGVAVAQKEIIQSGEKYTLLAIVPRSAGYKEEWAGNFTVGDMDIHDGFKQARDEILRFVKKYINENNIEGSLKVWIPGWSRGAAVANMLGGFFAGGGIEYFGDNVSINPEDIYCYSMGTPSTVKNGLDKNVELSVSGKRSNPEYIDDTEGESYSYTKGGTVDVTDPIYNGIRSIIDPDDFFPLLPPEDWGFTHYGIVIDPNDGLDYGSFLNELNSISPYVYSIYTGIGDLKALPKKTFDLKTLSTVDTGETIAIVDLLKQRIAGMVNEVKTNKEYKNNGYEEALTAFAGVFGMGLVFLFDSSESGLDSNSAISALAYSYLAYVSELLQEEGKADNENSAITLALEDVLTYFTGEEIDDSTFTVDSFLELFAKYISENENEPVADAVINGIMNIVPEENKIFLSAFKSFYPTDDPDSITIEDGLKAFIKACYYGPDPNSSVVNYYENAEKVRSLLCITMIMFLQSDDPEIQEMFTDDEGNITGKAAKFSDAIRKIMDRIKTVKDDEGNVIKTYNDMSELADDKLIEMLENNKVNMLTKSEELYGVDYKNELSRQIDKLENNITNFRKIISSLFFYSENGYSTKTILENCMSLVGNASAIPLMHYNEIYVAKARTSNRYENHVDESDIFNPATEDGVKSYILLFSLSIIGILIIRIIKIKKLT